MNVAASVPDVVLAAGDGIGPEISEATLRILDAAGARVRFHPIEVGEARYRAGVSAGIDAESLELLRTHRVMLKGPITTPQGGGYKSLNVTLRKAFGLYANVRPCVSYAPALPNAPQQMDVVIIRENEEDLYAGIEHRQTDEVTQCLKLITRPGCERIARYAFEYARAHGRRKITCVTKDNIMKLTDGLFHQVFRELAADYPEITTEHQIVDIGTARLAVKPERYDVVLAPNLYGDILSDVAAEVAGSVGLAPSANVGDGIAMFEAIHGSAPDIAGQGVANPSGLLLSAVMMLVHLGQGRVATRIHNAWLKTLDDGIHSADIASSATVQRVGTDAFARAVIDRLGEVPRRLKTVAYHDGIATPTDAARLDNPAKARPRAVKTLDGVDVFLQWTDAGRDPNALGRALEPLASPEFALKMISNRGVKVYPGGSGAAYLADHWRCRFRLVDPAAGFKQMLALYARIDAAGLEIIKTEQLFRFDGEPGYALAQGE